MLIICAIGQRGGPELVKRLTEIIGIHADLLLLHVIDTGPRHDLGKYLRVHELELEAAEDAAGRAAMEEAIKTARQEGLKVTSSIKKGRPGEIIVQTASESNAAFIAIRASEGAAGHPRLGPASVGHTARFVVDHAPCDIFLLRGY
jgi:nucleotide-binding universal stress UspA family protein